jgi:Cytochrome oxidase complex assembly protein 1
MSYGYVTPPPSAPGVSGDLSPAQLQRRKNLRRTIIIIIAVVAVLLLVGLFVGGLFSIIVVALRSSEPYQHAVQTATHDPRVATELGAPVKPGWLFSGSIQTSGPSGSADIAVSLRGSARKGTLYVVARKSAGRWTYQTLELRAAGQPDLDLLQTSGAPRE